jgi:hypothetical protein
MAHSKGKHTKEVATHHAGDDVFPSFGPKPPDVPIGGGTMHTFGFRRRNDNGVWPTSEISVDVKTGFPKDFDKPVKGPRS